MAERDWIAIAKRLMNEQRMTAVKAAKLVPADRGPKGYASASTIVRWIVRGKHGVYLDGYKGPGKSWWTSQEALARFFARLSEVEAGKHPEPGPTVLQRERRAKESAEELRKLLATI